MTIISPLPYTLINGNVNDASQVMADLNQIRDDVNNNAAEKISGGYVGALVGKTGNQSVTTSGAQLAFDSESIDTSGIHSNVTNNSRLTTPADVTRVRLFATINYSAATIGNRMQATFLKNGSGIPFPLFASAADFVLNSALGSFSITSPVITCVAGDYFEVRILPTSTSVNITSTTWFEMQAMV